MWWVRAAAVLGLSVLLMGSKLIIRVPEGGSVISSSGLVACAAGETCTVDVDRRNFAETFTAVAADGYVFRGWTGGDAAVCGGTLVADCTELDSGPFSDFGMAASARDSGGTLTLLPASLFLRYNLGRGFFSPYVGVGYTFLNVKEETEFVGNFKGNGSNASLEAGFELKVNRHFFIDFGARFDQIEIKPENIDTKIDLGGLQAGISLLISF